MQRSPGASHRRAPQAARGPQISENPGKSGQKHPSPTATPACGRPDFQRAMLLVWSAEKTPLRLRSPCNPVWTTPGFVRSPARARIRAGFRALCSGMPRTPPGPEGSNGSGLCRVPRNHPGPFPSFHRETTPVTCCRQGYRGRVAGPSHGRSPATSRATSPGGGQCVTMGSPRRSQPV